MSEPNRDQPALRRRCLPFVRALAALVASSLVASSANASVRPQGIEVGAGALGARTTGAEIASGSRLFLEKDGAGHRDSVHLYAGFANDPVNLRDPTGDAIFVPLLIAAASLLAIEGIANAPDFGEVTLPSPGAGEIIAKTAVLAASGGVGYGLASGLGLTGLRLGVGTGAFGGAFAGGGFQATDDVVAGRLSGVDAYAQSIGRGFYLGGLFGGGAYGLGRGFGALRRATSFDDIAERGWASGVRSYAREATTVARAQGEANIVYRVIRAAENPAAGLVAKNPAATYTAEGHIIHGSREGWASQFISTTKYLSVAESWAARTGNRIVSIDLARVNGSVFDFSTGAGLRGITARNFARASGEVLIEGSVPAGAIRWVR